MTVQREPAIARKHPAQDLPERPTPAATATSTPVAVPADDEKLLVQHNVRIKPSTRTRIEKGHAKLVYETGDRSISIASITDAAINEYLERRGC